MRSTEQFDEAKKYFREQAAIRKESRLDVTGRKIEQWEEAWRSPNPKREEYIDVLREAAKEKRVVKKENWPVLIKNIGGTNDALITLTILEEGKKNRTGKATYIEIRNSLAHKMNLAEEEIEPVLGKYSALNERCNRLDGDIIQVTRTEGKKVYYSVAEEWQLQAEAYSNNVLTYGLHNVSFDAFGVSRQHERIAANGLPIQLEVARFLISQLAEKNKPVDATAKIPTSTILARFPDHVGYLKAYLPEILQDFETENLFTRDRVEFDEIRMECRLKPGAPEHIITRSSRKKDAYHALWTLQNEGKDPEKYYTSLDVAYRMAELFPDTYNFDENHDAELTLFLHNFTNIMNPGTKQDVLSFHERVAQVYLTPQNNYEAVSDIDTLLTDGVLQEKEPFTRLYRSETDPDAIIRVWLAGKYFDPKEHYAYKEKYLAEILPELKEFADDVSREQVSAFLKRFSKKADMLLYFLESDGYIKFPKREHIVAPVRVEAVPAVLPEVVFESRKPKLVIDDEIRNLAREGKYAHKIRDEYIENWEKSIRYKDHLGRMTEKEKVLWDFYTKLQARDKDVVLREKNNLIILNKPAEILLHEDNSNLSVIDVEGLARKVFSSEATLANELHSSDSGIVILATSDQALEGMLVQMRNRELSGMVESYSAILDGVDYMHTQTFLASDPLLYDHTEERFIPTSLRMQDSKLNIAMPVVEFTPQGLYRHPFSGKVQTLMDIRLIVGSSEEARALAAYSLRLPVIGDTRYTEPYRQKELRTMMHAGFVSFTDPETGDNVSVTAPLEQTFQKYLDSLSKIK